MEAGQYKNIENNFVDVIDMKVGIESFEECQKRCLEFNGCFFWTYDEQLCYLFNSNAAVSTSPCKHCIRGPRFCSGKADNDALLKFCFHLEV